MARMQGGVLLYVYVRGREREREAREEQKRERRGEEREREREEERSEKRGACHGRLNDDSKVDGFLGPFYIEIQRSA